MKILNINCKEVGVMFIVFRQKKVIVIKNNSTNFSVYFLMSKNLFINASKTSLEINGKINIFNLIFKIKTVLLKGFKKKILLVGLGYNVYSKNSSIFFKLGYSHTIIFNIPNLQVSLSIFKCRKKNINIILSGYNYIQICSLINQIKILKKPNAYKEIGFYNKNKKKKLKTFKKK